ncbi:MAG: DUF5947 family protein [Micromonosporaceae bacterium]
MNGAAPPEALRRLLERHRAPKPAAGERCEMCGEQLTGGHRHVAHLDARSLMCACTGCYLLFTSGGAGQGRYRAVPDRYRYQPEFRLTDEQWTRIGIPVRVAFCYHNSTLDSVVAFYPSPAGATEADLPSDTWDEVLRANPEVSDLASDVEALLLSYRAGGPTECFLVPIDACYELVGRIRTQWKGFDGGTEVWESIDGFFDRLRERSARSWSS